MSAVNIIKTIGCTEGYCRHVLFTFPFNKFGNKTWASSRLNLKPVFSECSTVYWDPLITLASERSFILFPRQKPEIISKHVPFVGHRAPSGQKFWLPVVSTDHMEPSHMLMPVCAPLHPATLALWVTCCEMLDAAGFICSHITQSTALLRPDSGGKKEWLVGSGNPIPQAVKPQVLLRRGLPRLRGQTYWARVLMTPPFTDTWSGTSCLTFLGFRLVRIALFCTFMSSCSEDKIIYLKNIT